MVSFINLFFVPVIALSVYYRRFDKTISNNARLIVDYCIFAVAVNIGSYVIAEVLTRTIGIGPSTDSILYMIISVPVAYIIPYLYEIYKKYVDIKCEIKKK